MQKKIIAVANAPSTQEQELYEAYEQFEKDLAQSIDPKHARDSPEHKIISEKIHEAIEHAKVYGELYLDNCELVKVPESLHQLTNLQTLNLSRNKLVEFLSIKSIPAFLENIDLSRNSIFAFPTGYRHYISAGALNLHLNPITVRTGDPSKDDITEVYSPMTHKKLRKMYPDSAEAPQSIRSFLESTKTENGCRENIKTGKLYSP